MNEKKKLLVSVSEGTAIPKDSRSNFINKCLVHTCFDTLIIYIF